jgi:DNA replication protein DnaC
LNLMDQLDKKLKTLKLGGVLNTLDERLKQAKNQNATFIEFLETILGDEIERREAKKLDMRLARAGFEEEKTLEGFDWGFNPTIPAKQFRELSLCLYLARHEHILLVGQVGVGKTHLGQSLGHAACRKGYTTLFVKAPRMFAHLNGGRADGTRDRRLRTYLTPDLLIIDEFGLRRLTSEQADDFYDIVTERHLSGSMIITSNRDLKEWVQLFPDPVLGNSAMDRLAHNAHQIVLKGPSYRKHAGPGGARRDGQGESAVEQEQKEEAAE